MMKLGMISHYSNEALSYVKSKGLSYVEFTINHHENEFFDALSETMKLLSQHKQHVLSVGRWGTDRITKDGVNQDELLVNKKMIDACVSLNAPVFVTGVNYVSELSESQNMTYALAYLNELMTYANDKKIKLAVYNCRWNNFIVGPDTWDIVLKKVPGIGIKYDPSHAIYDFKNYLKEIKDYGKYIYHFHLKGALIVDNERVDDPPAGLDMTNWKAVMGLLYFHGYQGGLSIEPHSDIWKHELGDFGIDYTIDFFKPMIKGEK